MSVPGITAKAFSFFRQHLAVLGGDSLHLAGNYNQWWLDLVQKRLRVQLMKDFLDFRNAAVHFLSSIGNSLQSTEDATRVATKYSVLTPIIMMCQTCCCYVRLVFRSS